MNCSPGGRSYDRRALLYGRGHGLIHSDASIANLRVNASPWGVSKYFRQP
jgi:hypothetical protein